MSYTEIIFEKNDRIAHPDFRDGLREAVKKIY